MNWEELKLVNRIRQGTTDWQHAGYPGVTSTTRNLINHWTDREEFPLYFAQIDALLTHIYLRETSPADITQDLQRINLKYNDGIDRLAHKMATATGKTPVMAMLILWQAANHYASGQVDTWYDTESFRARLINVKEVNRNQRTLKNLLDAFRRDIDREKWDQMLTNTTIPFDLPEEGVKIAIKVIDQYGMEHMTVIDVPRKLAAT